MAEPSTSPGVGRRYFLDTEFIEDGKTIELLSIGVVCEDGREYYAEVKDADWGRANDWVVANVLPHLHVAGWTKSFTDKVPDMPDQDRSHSEVKSRWEIASDLLGFVEPTFEGDQGKPEFWGYYADYDWVVLCQLFGRMLDLPTGWPMFCMDLKQLAVEKGDPTLPEQSSTEHHALADARWNVEVYRFLTAQSDEMDPHTRVEGEGGSSWR